MRSWRLDASIRDSGVSGTALDPDERPSPTATAGSFRTILKSSALIGASSLISVALGALRTKAIALMLGPAGIGLLGAFGLVLDLARSVAQLGLNGSGVRQIAESASSGDERRLAVTALVLRRVTLVCGLVGAIVLAAGSHAISTLTFGTDEHATSIMVLSVAVLLSVLAGGQGALLQGMRRVAEQAKVNVYSALIGTLAAVALVYMFAERGIVASLLAAAAASVALSWWYGRQVKTVEVALRPGEMTREAAALLKLGLAFLVSGLLMTGAAYAVRTFVLRTLGLDAAGMYQAAWTLGGLYVGFVLQALGTDFYPRLVGVIDDHRRCNATVNEQAYASLLMAAPGIVATITFAPLVVHLFYSAAFGDAVELLRWICMGMALRVITWPIGYIIVAKNRQLTFFAVELAWAVYNVAVTWWCLREFGLEGAGIGFMLSYVFHALIVYPTARRLTGFRWTGTNLHTGACFVLVVGLAFATQRWLPTGPAYAVGTCLSLGCAWYSARTLLRLSDAAHKVPGLRWLLRLERSA
jgi:enterobacterial common antigen flippase